MLNGAPDSKSVSGGLPGHSRDPLSPMIISPRKGDERWATEERSRRAPRGGDGFRGRIMRNSKGRHWRNGTTRCMSQAPYSCRHDGPAALVMGMVSNDKELGRKWAPWQNQFAVRMTTG